jgi:transcriptional regulator with XRE-family HTH domain
VSEFGARLARHRQQRGWTQRQMAGHLGVGLSRSTLAGVEAGRDYPSQRLWAAVTAVMPEAVDELRPLFEQARKELQDRALAPRVNAPKRGSDATDFTMAELGVASLKVVYVRPGDGRGVGV